MKIRSVLTMLICSVIIFSCQTSFAFIGSVVVSPETVRQGKTFAVYLTSSLPLRECTARFLGKTMILYSAEAGYRGLIGIHPSTKPSTALLSIIATDDAGLTEERTVEVVIKPTRFLAEKLVFPPSKNEKLSQKKLQNDQNKVAEVMEIETPAQLWSGRFILPIKGYITSPYGAYRLYNGMHLADHRGVDIGGNPVGANIKAANSGVVAFTQFLKTIGSTIIIDHGQGINSIYMHMSKTLVKAGDKVKKGQVIGRVGSTGLSNGPHLHWGISVHNIRINPLEWTTRLVAE